MNRRWLLSTGLSTAGLALASCAAPAEAQTAARAAPSQRATLLASPPEKQLVPLPWDPASFQGLSAKLLTEHHDKNYGSAVKKLNEIRTRLITADPEKAGGYWSEYGSLKSAELAARNSSLLHELYFENLGSGAPPASLATALGARFGGVEQFERLARASGMAASGWVVLAFDRASNTLEIVQTEGHAFGSWSAEPLVVLDVFEHAYAIDYGPNKGPYLDAFFRNLAWPVVARRLEAALSRG